MIKKLAERVVALESLSAPVVVVDEEAEARREKARAALLEMIQDPSRARREYDALDAAGRIHHWLRKLKDAEDYVASYSDTPPPEYKDTTVAPGVNKGMWQLSLKIERDKLEGGECHFGLTAARLDRLAELGYHDQVRMQEWNALRRKWEKLPLQWRKDDIVFPEDALILLAEIETAVIP